MPITNQQTAAISRNPAGIRLHEAVAFDICNINIRLDFSSKELKHHD
jgi:hypothetical protein